MLFGIAEDIEILDSNIAEIEEGIDVFISTTYALNDIVQKDGDIFKSLKDNNISTPIKETTNLEWKYKGKVNYSRMFDPYQNTQTINQDSIEYTIKTDYINAIGFFNLEAASVTVEAFDLENKSLYIKTKKAYQRDVTDTIITLFTAKRKYKKTVIFNDLPFFKTAKLKIIISNPDTLAKCGHFVHARMIDLGITLADPKPISSIRNLISKEKNEDGIVITTNSMTYKRVVANIICNTEKASYIQDFLEDYTTTYGLYIADEREGGIDALAVYAIYKDFDMAFGVNITQYELELEGVI